MATDTSPQTEKQIAIDALLRMPESATLNEISQEIAILAAIRRGETEADEGRVVSHEDLRRKSAAWISR